MRRLAAAMVAGRAATGVDLIWITRSAPILDLGLDIAGWPRSAAAARRRAGTGAYRRRSAARSAGRSSSASSFPPTSTTTVDIHIQVINPKIAPSEP